MDTSRCPLHGCASPRFSCWYCQPQEILKNYFQGKRQRTIPGKNGQDLVMWKLGNARPPWCQTVNACVSRVGHVGAGEVNTSSLPWSDGVCAFFSTLDIVETVYQKVGQICLVSSKTINNVLDRAGSIAIDFLNFWKCQWGCRGRSVVQHLPSMQGTLGYIPSTAKKKRQKERRERGRKEKKMLNIWKHRWKSQKCWPQGTRYLPLLELTAWLRGWSIDPRPLACLNEWIRAPAAALKREDTSQSNAHVVSARVCSRSRGHSLSAAQRGPRLNGPLGIACIRGKPYALESLPTSLSFQKLLAQTGWDMSHKVSLGAHVRGGLC